ncbi:MAG TPA: Hint domain-containing protein, partial [Pirellulales bacterium]|nr:Hint domain-containing protein [Pirellulales bacterium]
LGSYNPDPTTGYTLTETGNYLAGALTLAETGTDRYSLIEAFNNASNAALSNGNGPGDLDFSPVGAPIVMGGLSYWGTGPAANLDANAADSAFNELGLQLLHEYCWAFDDPLMLPTGNDQPMESGREGMFVLSASDRDPEGARHESQIAKFFSNGRKHVINLEVEGHVCRPTPNHPIYARGRGFVPAGELRPGDELLTDDFRWVKVSAVVDKGEVVPVFNLAVANDHTYFIGSKRRWGFCFLVHNESPGEKSKENLPSTAGENEYAQEGRVAGAAIEEHDEAQKGSNPQAETTRKGDQPGRQDIGKGGSRKKGAEIGPASRTGVPRKVEQNASLPKEGNVIVFRQKSKPPKAGESVEFVELTAKQAKRLADEIRKSKSMSADEIFARAKELAGGKSGSAVVSEKAAAYAGEQYLRGQKMGARSGPNSRRGIMVIPVPKDVGGLASRMGGAAGKLQAAGSAGIQMLAPMLLEEAFVQLDEATGGHMSELLNDPLRQLDRANEALGGDPDYFEKKGHAYNQFWDELDGDILNWKHYTPKGEETGWLQYQWHKLVHPEAYDENGTPLAMKKSAEDGGSGDK